MPGRSGWFKYALLMPAVLTLVALVVFPVGYTVYISLNKWRIGLGDPTFIGFENFRRLFSDEKLWQSIWVTFYLTALCLAIEIGGGVYLALLLNRPFRGRGAVRTLMTFSMSATPVAVALIWVLMYNPTLGILNYLLSKLGLPPQMWTNSATSVIPALAIVDAWQWTPFVFLIVLGGLQSLPSEPLESAAIDGATWWQQIWHVTLPLVRPYIMVAVMFRLIDTLKLFDIIYVMTGGGPGRASENLNIFAYKTAFMFFDMGRGSALLMIVFLIVLAITLLTLWARERSWSY